MVVVLFALGLVAMGWWVATDTRDWGGHVGAAWAVFSTSWVGTYVYFLCQSMFAGPSQSRPWSFGICPAGVALVTEHLGWFMLWKGIRSVVREEEHVIVEQEEGARLPLPCDSIGTDDDVRRFLDLAQQWHLETTGKPFAPRRPVDSNNPYQTPLGLE
jgi:hypothetical protein